MRFTCTSKTYKQYLKRAFLGIFTAFFIGNILGIVTQATEIPKEFVRFHIIANSDSEADQAIKWDVREAIFNSLDLSAITSKESALEYFQSHCDEIEAIANKILRENNVSYTAQVNVEKKEFPLREYSDFVLPRGIYDSVCITLGSGEGKNFFCVMYPSLCMIEGVTQSSRSNAEIIGSVLTEEQASAITGNKKQVICKFKIAELFDFLW
ncbi:MAG: stage II sporulation protein R [Clostridia bacterium]|nr:stage II sporulation protein R [Clostridia bacterium]